MIILSGKFIPDLIMRATKEILDTRESVAMIIEKYSITFRRSLRNSGIIVEPISGTDIVHKANVNIVEVNIHAHLLNVDNELMS